MDSVIRTCPDCGTEVAPSLLSCPSCARLVHAERLKELAAQGEAAEREGNVQGALFAWREALSLLPPESRQHGVLQQKIKMLSAKVEDLGEAPASSPWKKGAAGLGGMALVLFKFKSILILVLTKAKFLLLGLTKLPTLLSMLLTVGVFWTQWGWTFVLGLALSIYVHEMGHVWMFHRYGIPASAPMFIPGLAAFTRGKYYPATAIESARIAMAGPMWGMAAAAVCYAVYVSTQRQYWGALAQVGAVINLINLIPLPFLDGDRCIRSLTRGQRWLLALACLGMYFFTGQTGDLTAAHRQNPLLVVIAIAVGARAMMGDAPRQRDDFGLFQYVLLILTLGSLAAIDVPIPAAK